MSPRTQTRPLDDPRLWRRLLSRVHQDALQAAETLLEILGRDKAVHALMFREAQGISTRLLESVSQDPGGAALHRALREKLRHFASAWVG